MNKVYINLNELLIICTRIYGPLIQNMFQFLIHHKLFISSFSDLFVRVVNHSQTIIIFNNLPSFNVHNYKIIYNLAHLSNCIHLSINDTIVYGTPIIEEHIHGHKIIRHYNTFHQSNEMVKSVLYSKIYNIVNSSCSNIVCVGGECYVYAKILFNKYRSCTIYSDYNDIIYYSYANLMVEKDIKNIRIHKVSYQQCFIEQSFNKQSSLNEQTEYIIFNVRSLLPSHINVIKKLNPLNIIIVSCNDNNIKKLRQLVNYTIEIIPLYNIKLIICKQITHM